MVFGSPAPEANESPAASQVIEWVGIDVDASAGVGFADTTPSREIMKAQKTTANTWMARAIWTLWPLIDLGVGEQSIGAIRSGQSATWASDMPQPYPAEFCYLDRMGSLLRQRNEPTP